MFPSRIRKKPAGNLVPSCQLHTIVVAISPVGLGCVGRFCQRINLKNKRRHLMEGWGTVSRPVCELLVCGGDHGCLSEDRSSRLSRGQGCDHGTAVAPRFCLGTSGDSCTKNQANAKECMCQRERDVSELSATASCQSGRQSRNSREKCVLEYR